MRRWDQRPSLHDPIDCRALNIPSDPSDPSDPRNSNPLSPLPNNSSGTATSRCRLSSNHTSSNNNISGSSSPKAGSEEKAEKAPQQHGLARAAHGLSLSAAPPAIGAATTPPAARRDAPTAIAGTGSASSSTCSNRPANQLSAWGVPAEVGILAVNTDMHTYIWPAIDPERYLRVYEM